MRHACMIMNLLVCLLLYVVSSLGMATFRTHSISVATEIARLFDIQTARTTELEQSVAATGNVRTYYRAISTIAAGGFCLNAAALAYSLWKGRAPGSRPRNHRSG